MFNHKSIFDLDNLIEYINCTELYITHGRKSCCVAISCNTIH